MVYMRDDMLPFIQEGTWATFKPNKKDQASRTLS